MVSTSQLYEVYLKHPLICTDTRNISPDCLFFALKGENFDGNLFAQQALDAGAAYAVVDRITEENERFLLVNDGLRALQDLARMHRQKLQIPVLGITGSNGKTTTKELLYAVLSQHFRTFATSGNLNNHIGVPLSILSIKPDTELAIIEMGANHQNEIALLSSISQPSHGLITNIGKAHLEGFGGIEGVKIGKGELYQFLSSRDGIAFINRESADLMEMSERHGLENTVYYGKSDQNEVSGELVADSPYLKFNWHSSIKGLKGKTYTVQTHLTGAYNLDNLLAAVTAGVYFGLSPEEINAGLKGYIPNNNRSQITKTAKNTLICDYYNANPSSMHVALDNLGKMQGEHKVIILGDMFELGEESGFEHAEIIKKTESMTVERCIFIGKDFFEQRKHAKAEFYQNTEEAYRALQSHPVNQATVLIKGSRGMKLEKLVELF